MRRRFEYKVFRVQVMWEGDYHYLGAMIHKDDDEFPNADHLGERGWEFVAFVPDAEVYIKDSFTPAILPYIRMAVFKREVAEDEHYRFGEDRPH